MNRVRELVHAEKVQEQGIQGQGVSVAVLDTGIYKHEDFGNRIIGFYDFVNHKSRCYDDCSHGTHVSSILGGNGILSGGKYRGIAPRCKIIHVKVLDHRGNGSKDDVLKGIDWVIQNQNRYQIRIMNISVGTVKESKTRDMQLVEAVERAWDAGIVVVVAAGNMGPEPMSITVPGNSRKVITVGSSDDCQRMELRSGTRRCYSGTGPTTECICKPDIVTPGSAIMACKAPIHQNNNGYYCMKSGTSMATPVVSGGIALLLSKYPRMSNVEVKMKLRETAVDLGLPQNRQGWGLLDVGKLLK